MPARVMSPQELASRLEGGDPILVLDVREMWEVELGMLPQSVWIPLDELPGRLHEVPGDRDVVVVCHHGIRSAFAARSLHNSGHERVFNLQGGVDRWAREVDDDFPTY